MRFKAIIFILVLTNCYAFSQTEDFEVWSGLKLEKELTAKLSLTNETQLRMNNNVMSLDGLLTEFDLEYKFTQNIRLSGCYRFVKKQDNQDFMYSQHRYNVDLTLREKYKRFRLNFRNRIQSRYSRMFSDDMGLIPEYCYRSKFSLGYNIRKNPITPAVAGELFYQLTPLEDKQINKFRIRAGIGYKISDFSDLDIFYMFEREVDVPDRKTTYILGIKYSYSL